MHASPPFTRRPSPLRRLLIVNDDMDMRPSLARQLAGQLQCAVETAGSTKAALLALATHPPQAVLVDSSTLASCLQVLHALRAAPGGDMLAIVVLSGQRTDGDARALRDAGADTCLRTPIAASELARCLLGLVMTAGHPGGGHA